MLHKIETGQDSGPKAIMPVPLQEVHVIDQDPHYRTE